MASTTSTSSITSTTSVYRGQPLMPDQGAPRVDEAPVAGKAASGGGVRGEHTRIRRQERAAASIRLDPEIHRGHSEPSRGKCPELVRRARSGGVTGSNHGRSDDELTLPVVRQLHERGAQRHVENRQVLGRIENVLRTRPAEPANGRQRSKEADVGGGDLVQRAPHLRRGRRDVALVVLGKVIAGQDLVEAGLSGSPHLADGEGPCEEHEEHPYRDRRAAAPSRREAEPANWTHDSREA